MPNYCSNSVLFLGEPAAVKSLEELFSGIERRQKETEIYHLPDFVTENEGYMEDISVTGQWIDFETRWAPNVDILVQIADRYQVGFLSRYEEKMSGIYGEAIYTDGQLKTVDRNKHDKRLDQPDPELTAIRLEQTAHINKLSQVSNNWQHR